VTEPRYLADSYARQFEATVERALDDRVALDRTLFYPEGGGQPDDRGRLRADGRTFRVVGVEKSDTIYHRLSPADGGESVDPPAEGTTVTGELDWERRYAHMRYHTAQHLLSAVLLAEFDARTTGNQLYADRARIDCEHDRFEADDLDRVERAVREVVDRDLPVVTDELDRERAERTLDTDRTRIDLLPDSVQRVRVVAVGDDEDPFDRTACAGTHVRRTGEVGEFDLLGRETAGAGEERLRFELSTEPAPSLDG
jgi:misacylated tRNA(Ala) deacylase